MNELDKVRVLENEVFALRDGESACIIEDPPIASKYIGVILLPCVLPGRGRKRDDGYSVRDFAVVACELHKGEWQWCCLAPATKEFIAVLMEQAACELNRWYWLLFDQGELKC